MPLNQRFFGYTQSFSFIGLAVAALFFAASVTPSLLPRHYLFQGILSGFASSLGYAIGVGFVLLYHFLEFRDPPPRVQRIAKGVTTVAVAILVLLFVRQATFWQNSIRMRMEMPQLETSYPFRMMLIALLTATGLHLAARLVLAACGNLTQRMRRFIPRRFAQLMSAALIGLLILFVGEGIVTRGMLRVADRIFLHADQVIDEGIDQPTNRLQTGSEESVVPWDSIGRRGKEFIVGGPTQQSIASLTGQPALQPIRVYVGMRSAEELSARAELALDELIRVGGFERSAMIIATPTGTGWLDPGGVDTAEYLLGGDCAIVSMQYSYLPSWMTILIDPRRSIESAAALFRALYDHWVTLPVDSRPKLYLFGLSLGALGSEVSPDLLRLLETPIDGGLFSGPPFPSRQWASLTANRNPGSPEFLPRIRDGRIVRFTNQFAPPDRQQPWGSMRFLYIEYASDPMVFFSPSLAYREGSWMQGERGKDVSPFLRWVPLVTFLQIGFDLPMATSVPHGYGHNYAPRDYIDGWAAVLDRSSWSDAELGRLKAHFDSGQPLPQ